MAVAFVRDHTGMSIKTAGTTNAYVNISTATTPGNVLVARILFDNAATANTPTVVSIEVPAGETAAWEPLGAARAGAYTAGLYSSGEMFAIRTTMSWPVAQYTVTLSASVTQKATDCQEFSGVLAAMRSTSGAAWQVATTAASASTTGTAPQVGDLAVGFIFGSNAAAAQAGSDNTTGGSWSAAAGLGSTGGSGATNNFGVAQYKILTAASHQTYANSAAMTAGNGAIVAILQQYVDPSLTQAGFGFYADGTETGSTALAAQDTTPTVDTSAGDVNAQLRVRLQSTTSAAVDATDDFQLQWEKNASGTWDDVRFPLIDSFVGANNSVIITSVKPEAAQSFQGDGRNLAGARFAVSRSGSPTGAVSAALYAHTGTFGSDGTPTGGPLAVSTNVVLESSLPTSVIWWALFVFDGTFTLDAGTPYFIAARTTNQGTGGAIIRRATAGGAPGNSAEFTTSWTTNAGDVWFEVHAPGADTAIPYDSPNLTDNAATTSRLTGGTGTFTAGKVSEDGLADDVGFSGNNHTELLYSLTFKAADLTAGDTLRFRVLRNGSTSGFTYAQVPTVTIGGGGPQAKPLAGTVAATSATTGTIGMVSPPKDYPLAGTVAGVTASTGSPAGVHPLAGATVTATTTTAGSIDRQGQAYPLAGAAAGTTTTVGDPAARHPLAGTLPASSTTAGAVAAIHPLAGTTPASSATAGAPAAVHPLIGAAPATTTTTGTIGTVVGPVAYPLAGTVTATTTTPPAALRLDLALVGTTAGTATTVGDPAAVHPLAGTLPAVTTTSGTIRSALPLAGTIAGAATAAGSPTAVHPLVGATPAVSNVTGTPNAVYGLTGGPITGVSATFGTINLVGGAQNYPLAGTLPAVSSTTGSPVARHPLIGSTPATSTTTGDPAARHPLTSTTAAVTTTAGTITATHPLTGTAAGIATITGIPAARHPLAGAAAGTTTTSGTINIQLGPQDYPLAGVLTATTTTAGALRAARSLTGTTTATTTTTGTLTQVALGGRPKTWTGAAWTAKPGKVWTGSAWVEKPFKTWTGTQWEKVT